MKRTIGLVTIAMSALIFAIIIMLAKIAMYVDSLQDTFKTNYLSYVPGYVYLLIVISVAIGAFLTFTKSNKDTN